MRLSTRWAQQPFPLNFNFLNYDRTQLPLITVAVLIIQKTFSKTNFNYVKENIFKTTHKYLYPISQQVSQVSEQVSCGHGLTK